MRYDYDELSDDEIVKLKKAVKKYKDYDRLDFIIMLILVDRSL